jgi:hypothetical protein
MPTAAPTAVPTAAPTAVPTAAPTAVPTAATTDAPTATKHACNVGTHSSELSTTQCAVVTDTSSSAFGCLATPALTAVPTVSLRAA